MQTSQQLAEEIRAFTWQLNRKISQESAEIGEFTSSQEAVAVRVYQHPGSTGAEIARQLLLSPQAVNLTVLAMVDAGYLLLQKNEQDGRRKELHLTDQGIAEVERIRAYRTAWLSEQLETHLTGQERNKALAAITALKKVLPEL